VAGTRQRLRGHQDGGVLHGFKVFGEEVELDVGGRRFVQVRLEPVIAPALSKAIADPPGAKGQAKPAKPAFQYELGMAFALVPKKL
jgi:hypothetical protein